MDMFGKLQVGPAVGVQEAKGLTKHCEARSLVALCIGGLSEDLAIFSPRVMRIIERF